MCNDLSCVINNGLLMCKSSLTVISLQIIFCSCAVVCTSVRDGVLVLRVTPVFQMSRGRGCDQKKPEGSKDENLKKNDISLFQSCQKRRYLQDRIDYLICS